MDNGVFHWQRPLVERVFPIIVLRTQLLAIRLGECTFDANRLVTVSNAELERPTLR